MLSRHGIRNPGPKDIRSGHDVLLKMNNSGANPVIVERLNSVLESFPLEEASMLTETGAEEQRELGRRTGQRFASVFRKNRHMTMMTFISSTVSRANFSKSNFEQGFDEGLSGNAISSYQTRNDLLRFFEHCSRYVTEVKTNEAASAEFRKFREKMYPQVVQCIARRLSVNSLNLSDDEVSSLYKLAAVEHAVLRSRNWANLLSSRDLDILEFASDLKQYYWIGSGHPINYEMSCPLIADIFRRLDDAVSGNASSRGVFYFAHAETVAPVLTALGLFRDDQPLRAVTFDNRSLHADARKFRTSTFLPFFR